MPRSQLQRWACPKCPQTVTDLKEHLAEHLKYKPLTCNLCTNQSPVGFYSRIQAEAHFKSRHRGRDIQLVECRKHKVEKQLDALVRNARPVAGSAASGIQRRNIANIASVRGRGGRGRPLQVHPNAPARYNNAARAAALNQRSVLPNRRLPGGAPAALAGRALVAPPPVTHSSAIVVPRRMPAGVRQPPQFSGNARRPPARLPPNHASPSPAPRHDPLPEPYSPRHSQSPRFNQQTRNISRGRGMGSRGRGGRGGSRVISTANVAVQPEPPVSTPPPPPPTHSRGRGGRGRSRPSNPYAPGPEWKNPALDWNQLWTPDMEETPVVTFATRKRRVNTNKQASHLKQEPLLEADDSELEEPQPQPFKKPLTAPPPRAKPQQMKPKRQPTKAKMITLLNPSGCSETASTSESRLGGSNECLPAIGVEPVEEELEDVKPDVNQLRQGLAQSQPSSATPQVRAAIPPWIQLGWDRVDALASRLTTVGLRRDGENEAIMKCLRAAHKAQSALIHCRIPLQSS